MAHDGKILARSRDIIANRKQRNEELHNSRILEVYANVPEIKEIDSQIPRVMSRISLQALKSGKNAGKAVAEARNTTDNLFDKKSRLLIANGYPANYLDEIYTCSICRDTGYVEGMPCTCLEDVYKRETAVELSSVLNLQDQCFENFNLNYYDAQFSEEIKMSPRNMMTVNFEICKSYATNFGTNSRNLLFRGNTGLGKTFLSASIAKVVSEKGFSVVYDTAVSVMDAFEIQKFNRDSDLATEANSKVRRYMNCDLLILDDLGTEMSTSFTVSALYNLLNTRLVNNKKTIISTNNSQEQMYARYKSPIMSRIRGDYDVLNFVGEDIRNLKKTASL